MPNRKNVAILSLFLFILLFLWVSFVSDVNYLLVSFGIIIVALLLIIIRFEKRKLEARELVLIAVLAAIAAVGRIPFASIPSVQPTTFVIMMAGLIFGAETGFMVGVVAALSSNMILGQGPWTPWQMVAWGLVGLTAGLLSKSKFMSKITGKIIFGVVWGFLFGWIMNMWSLFSITQTGSSIDKDVIITYLAGSLLFDSFHAISNVIFLVLFGSSWIKLLSRFKVKYGLLEK
jgi:energy-coupling factor transport system substrate-specific component